MDLTPAWSPHIRHSYDCSVTEIQCTHHLPTEEGIVVQPLLGSFCSPDIIGGNRNLGSFVCCPLRHFLPWGRASE